MKAAESMLRSNELRRMERKLCMVKRMNAREKEAGKQKKANGLQLAINKGWQYVEEIAENCIRGYLDLERIILEVEVLLYIINMFLIKFVMLHFLANEER